MYEPGTIRQSAHIHSKIAHRQAHASLSLPNPEKLKTTCLSSPKETDGLPSDVKPDEVPYVGME